MKVEITRRNLLKTTGSVVAAAAVAGCGNSSRNDDQVVNHGTDLNYDPNTEKILHTTGAYNCGSRCQQKVHVKNGKVIRFTSSGDKPRGQKADEEAEWDSSELGKPMENRACVRCYGGYQGILYQPDRLKYPLMRDGTKPKGDPNGFKRVSWDTALNAAVNAIKAAYDRADKENLPYAPLIARNYQWPTMATILGKMKPHLKMNGNESFGGVDLAKVDSVGFSAPINSRTDRYNTKFMITWALDTTRTTYYTVHTHFLNTKIKETGKIPMVVISSNHSDAVAMHSTGVIEAEIKRVPGLGGAKKEVDIPGWIACRPATDGALVTAMAYVIYKNKRYSKKYLNTEHLLDNTIDEDYPLDITDYPRKCFGFWANDKVVSCAPEKVGDDAPKGKAGFPILATRDILPTDDFYEGTETITANSSLNGVTFKVPKGESYQEYLESREVEWGGATAAPGKTTADYYKYEQPEDPADEDEACKRYEKVLEYVACLTGVRADVIEALAFKYSEYSNTEYAAFIDSGGGPQRAWNAGEWVWSMLCLSAMCGYADRKGGGLAGMSMSQFPETLAYTRGGVDSYIITGGAGNPKSQGGINIELSSWQHLVLTGKDHRSEQDIIDDAKYQFDIDLTGKFPLEVDTAIYVNNNNLMTHPNTSKNARAYDKIKTVIIIDQVMTPSAMMADIILPACTHLEIEDSYNTSFSNGLNTYYYRQKAVDIMYDTWPEQKIETELWNRLNAAMNDAGGAPRVANPHDAAAYTSLEATRLYKDSTGQEDAKLPPLETLQKEGSVTFITPKDKPIIPMKDYTRPGTLDTSTGYINFYSPIRAMRPAEKIKETDPLKDFLYYPGGWRNATACYQPLLQGYEMFFKESQHPLNPLGVFTGYKSPFSGRTYKLYYMTNKSRNRAHTVFDGVAAIKDQFPQMVKINPATAAERGIKEGNMVYVYNDRGCTKIPARLTHQILPGVVCIEHGAWYRPSAEEKVTVWMQTGDDENDRDKFLKTTAPVDLGGNDNVLTNDFFGEDTLWCGGAVPAQSGPCEISLINPDKLH